MNETPTSAQTPFSEEATSGGFALAEFADNPEPRCACILLLDTSGSMSGQPINELNLGLRTFKDELCADPLAAKRVEVAIITFGDAPQLAVDFCDPMTFNPPALMASGATPMGGAIRDALSRLEARKSTYRANGISYYRPWIFLLTDGGPTDEWISAAQQVRDGEAQGKFSFFAVGVGSNADMQKLGQIAPPERPPVKLDGLRFRDLFVWLSKSMRSVSRSAVGTAAPLDAPGWISAPA